MGGLDRLIVTTLSFLSSPRGNYFMSELLAAIASAAERRGVATSLGGGSFPQAATDAAFIVIPHEFFALAPDGEEANAQALSRTVGLCVEQPGTYSFEVTCGLAPRLGGMIAVHPAACRELGRRGIAAAHFPLGYIPEWDTWQNKEAERAIDVLYLGSHDERRAALLASYGETLWPRRQRIVLARPEWHRGPGPSFVVGQEKHALLRSSKVMLNLHREGATGVEWVRVLEAVCNGAVVITEHSRDYAPLVAGEHFVSGRPGDLGLLADLLLDDNRRLRDLRDSAYRFIREELPLDRSIDQLLAVTDALPARRPAMTARRAPHAGRDDAAQDAEIARRLAVHLREELQPLRAAIKELTAQALQTRHALARLEHAAAGEVRLEPTLVTETDAYGTVTPRVSVAVALDHRERDVITTLESIAASEHDSFEILILDDASTDDSVAAVSSFLAERPWLPARLLCHPSRRGLGATRNALVVRARGASVLILDAGNAAYPTALVRLEQALAGDPGASLAYPLGVVVLDGKPTGLASAHAWHPTWLRAGNYIDSTVMLRRDQLLAIGGYCEDSRVGGYEDYDLWCRLADRGARGVHVPEMLASYRRTSHGTFESSTNTAELLTSIDDVESRSLILARAPRLFGPGLVDDPYRAVGLHAQRSRADSQAAS